MRQVEVFVNNNDIIEVVVQGRITLSVQQEIHEKTINFVTVLEEEGKPIYVLMDFREVDGFDPSAQKLAMHALFTSIHRKIACFGGSGFMRNATNMIATLTGKGDSIRNFKTREEAEQWLLSNTK